MIVSHERQSHLIVESQTGQAHSEDFNNPARKTIHHSPASRNNHGLVMDPTYDPSLIAQIMIGTAYLKTLPPLTTLHQT